MSKITFKAFVKNKEGQAAAKEFADSAKISDAVIKGDIATATEQFANEKSPEFLLVELTAKDSAKAFEELDKLANVCDAETKVIVCGTIDELSFYKELIKMGIAEYLLSPIKANQIERAINQKPEERKSNTPPRREDSKVIAVIGSRGGVGTSIIAANIAGFLASRNYPTALFDFDADFGSAALTFDIEPSKGLIDALEKPDRVDSLFLDRVMTKVNDSLFVISAERNLVESFSFDEEAGEKIIKQMQTKFAYIVVDVPNVKTAARYILSNAEVILVTEFSLAGLRDSMRICDVICENLKNQDVTIVANKVGLAKKYETPQKDFEQGLGKKINYVLPFEAESYGYNDSGKLIVLAENNKSKLAEGIKQIAAKFMPEAIGVKKEEKKKGFLAALKK